MSKDRDSFLSSSIRSNDKVCDSEIQCTNELSKTFNGYEDSKSLDESIIPDNMLCSLNDLSSSMMLTKDNAKCQENGAVHNGNLNASVDNSVGSNFTTTKIAHPKESFEFDGQIVVKDKSYQLQQLIIQQQACLLIAFQFLSIKT